MKIIVQTIAGLALILSLTNCTAYVDPGGSASHTTTTRTITDDPYTPGPSVTTRTTRYR